MAGGTRGALGTDPATGGRLRLTLNGEGNAVVVHEFGDGEEGFEQAQREGGDWLRRHDQDGISQWLARAAQASQRMAWDHDYRHHISRRGF